MGTVGQNFSSISAACHSANGTPSTTRRRYAYVGTSGRVRMFLDPVATRFAREAEIVSLCDASLVRARYHRARLQSAFGYADVPVYAAGDFDRMLRETRADVVVVCTVAAAQPVNVSQLVALRPEAMRLSELD